MHWVTSLRDTPSRQGRPSGHDKHVGAILDGTPSDTIRMCVHWRMVRKYIGSRQCALMAHYVQLCTATAIHCFSTITTAIHRSSNCASKPPFVELAHTQRTYHKSIQGQPSQFSLYCSPTLYIIAIVLLVKSSLLIIEVLVLCSCSKRIAKLIAVSFESSKRHRCKRSRFSNQHRIGWTFTQHQ
jgi:tetrahydromethanopterin S-methyltransferase subunit E